WISQISSAERRLPNHGHADDMRGDTAMRNVVHLRRTIGATGSRRSPPSSHQLSNQDGIRLVIAKVVVVGGASFVVHRGEIAGRVQTSPHLDGKRRPFGIPG